MKPDAVDAENYLITHQHEEYEQPTKNRTETV